MEDSFFTTYYHILVANCFNLCPFPMLFHSILVMYECYYDMYIVCGVHCVLYCECIDLQCIARSLYRVLCTVEILCYIVCEFQWSFLQQW